MSDWQHIEADYREINKIVIDSRRAIQPRCNICGRFGYWDKDAQNWRFRCTYYDDYTGMYEHE